MSSNRTNIQPSLDSLGKIYRLLHGVFDPSPDLSPRRPYQPEPEGRGLILSEGLDQGWDQKHCVVIFLSCSYACKKTEILY